MQLDSTKLVALGIADQHAAVNRCPGIVHTARDTTGVDWYRSALANPQGRKRPKEWSVTEVRS